jgi:hypothetical protein
VPKSRYRVVTVDCAELSDRSTLIASSVSRPDRSTDASNVTRRGDGPSSVVNCCAVRSPAARARSSARSIRPW